jgi:hypothetical protein
VRRGETIPKVQNEGTLAYAKNNYQLTKYLASIIDGETCTF